MQRSSALILLLVSVATADNPLSKVLQVLAKLEAKVRADGEEEQAAFEKYTDWCRTGAQDKKWEIKTAKSDVEDLSATISKAASDIDANSQKIEALAGDLATADADLTGQTEMRKKERDEFLVAEKELVETIDTIVRATTILQRKLSGSALLEAKVDTNNMKVLVQTLETVVQAAGLAVHDRQKLLALAQSSDEDDDALDGAAMGAPAAAVYQSRSGSIIDLLEDLKEKAEQQLSDLRRTEVNSQHNYDLAKQSLETQIKVGNKEMEDAKSMKAGAQETQATAQGELEVTKKDLATAEETLRNMAQDCQTVAEDHEASTTSRQEELAALAKAQQVLQSMTGGASEQTYGASFLQISYMSSHVNVVDRVRQLGRSLHSPALAQLAGRLSSAMEESSLTGQDPFAKVKGLITDMIARLEKEASDEQTHKAYCDKEYAETKKKTDELKYDIEKFNVKIDQSKSESARLKSEVAELSREIQQITQSQATADALRQEEHKAYVQAKSDLEQGLEGVRLALKVLRDYYAAGDAALVQQPEDPGTHAKAAGAGGGIIAMLEVVLADFGKNLAGEEVEEESAATAYQKLTIENKVGKAMKEQDVKYKTKAATSLDKTIAETNSELSSTQSELDAVLDYTEQIRGMCEAKPETYEERAERRQQEIAGLKAALEALEGPTSFLQRFRGARPQ